MGPFETFEAQCRKLAGKHAKHLEISKIKGADMALPCFAMAKSEKRAPQEITKGLEKKFSRKLPSLVSEVKAAGPYLNFYLNYKKFSSMVVSEIRKKKRKYGSSDIGRKRVVVVEYSSPNIAKPLTIGHLSTTVMGQAIYNILSFTGYKCISDNHLGDWGTQFGKLLYAYNTWGTREIVEKNPIEELVALYVRFHREAEEDEKLNERAREWFKRLEDGDREAVKLWKWFTQVSIREFKETYSTLGVKFDNMIPESVYVPMTKSVINELLRKRIAKEEHKAVVVSFEDMPSMLVRKSDGATLYQTRDIATIKNQKKKFGFWKRLYVVGSEQKLYFEQVFRIAELLGYVKAGECVHVDVGQISLPTGRISTRKGNVVFLEDVISQTVEEAEKAVEEKNPHLESRKDVARKVAIGAIKYSNLSRDRARDMKFDIGEILSFEGDTGPYLLYTYARASSILRKSGKKPAARPKFSGIENDIIKKLALFPSVVIRSSEDFRPNVVANYAFELASLFNEFYHGSRVIGEKEEASRVALVSSVVQVLENALSLLGIESVSEM